jgi:hypothetical protein
MQPRASKRKKRAPLAPTGRTAVRPRETVVQDAPAANNTTVGGGGGGGGATANGFNLEEDLHRGFAEVLKQMGCDSAESTFARVRHARDHPLYRSIMSLAASEKLAALRDVVVRRQVLPVVTRAHEERFMRPVRPGETPCTRAAQCEGRLIAHCLLGDPDRGFVCPVFRAEEEEDEDAAAAAAAGDLCVLCLRKQTSVAFYTLRACGETPERVVQPYRNVIGVPGEYALGACLAVSPRRFEGLSGPFVRHERHHYAYEVDPPRLRQLGVDFRAPPPAAARVRASSHARASRRGTPKPPPSTPAGAGASSPARSTGASSTTASGACSTAPSSRTGTS